MENQSYINWSGYEILVPYEEDPFTFSKQLPPLDFVGYYPPLNWESDFRIQETAFDGIPLLESFPTESSYSSMEIISTSNGFREDFYSGNGSEFGLWEEMSFGFEPERKMSDNNGEGSEKAMKEKKMKRCREDKTSNELSRKTISRYFYMPITQAAKELNVGLTLLKKRCRELGIGRWPHRKLMSLQTLIKNVQELGKEEGEMSEAKVRDAVTILEEEKRLMEELPDMQLEDKTKRLRQACFKANYKKRKLVVQEHNPWEDDDASAVFSYHHHHHHHHHHHQCM